MEVVHLYVRIANLKSLGGLDVDVLQLNVGNVRLRQADDDTGPWAVDALHILNADVVEVRGEALHGGGSDRAVRHGLRVVLADEDGGFHPVHFNVLEGDIGNVVATVAIGLDADALVRPLEMDALGMDVLRAAGDLTPDGKTMAVVERAVRNRDVG